MIVYLRFFAIVLVVLLGIPAVAQDPGGYRFLTIYDATSHLPVRGLSIVVDAITTSDEDNCGIAEYMPASLTLGELECGIYYFYIQSECRPYTSAVRVDIDAPSYYVDQLNHNMIANPGPLALIRATGGSADAHWAAQHYFWLPDPANPGSMPHAKFIVGPEGDFHFHGSLSLATVTDTGAKEFLINADDVSGPHYNFKVANGNLTLRVPQRNVDAPGEVYWDAIHGLRSSTILNSDNGVHEQGIFRIKNGSDTIFRVLRAHRDGNIECAGCFSDSTLVPQTIKTYP